MSSCNESITFEELIEGLLDFFSGDKESVIIEEVQAFINRSSDKEYDCVEESFVIFQIQV